MIPHGGVYQGLVSGMRRPYRRVLPRPLGVIHAEGQRKAEVCKEDMTVLIDENVLWL